MPEGARLLVAGIATRALAQSAARAGYSVTAVDAFGDLDLRLVADVLAIRRETGTPWSPDAAARAASTLTAGFAAYTSNFENAPLAVSTLARGRVLLGNASSVLRAVRHPLTLNAALRRDGFRVPATRGGAPGRRTASRPARGWLLKPRGSGGGHGVRRWDGHGPVPRACYLQEHIAGKPGSIVFAADGRRALPVALTRQLVGDPAFGARGFRYCGSLLCSARESLFSRQDLVAGIAAELADAVTCAFGLVGLNGLDFVARGGIPFPIEVNPRWSASMELVERAHGLSMFELHARACRGELPAVAPYLAPAPVEGKAIVFASRPLIMAKTERWLGGPFADIPARGERIEAGHPICTVFGRGRTAAGCRAALVRRAGLVRGAAGGLRGAA